WHLQQSIKHFRTFSAANCQLLVGLISCLSELMQFVGNVKRGKDGNLPRINRQGSRGNFAHPLIDVFSQLFEIFRIAVRSNGVGLVIDFYPDGWRRIRFAVSFKANSGAHACVASALSGSAAVAASSMLCTFALMASRSANSNSICAVSSSLSPPTLRAEASCR